MGLRSSECMLVLFRKENYAFEYGLHERVNPTEYAIIYANWCIKARGEISPTIHHISLLLSQSSLQRNFISTYDISA